MVDSLESCSKLLTKTFGILCWDFEDHPLFRPLAASQTYYQERNMWVIGLFPQNKNYSIYKLENVENGIDINDLLTILSNNPEKPVYCIEKEHFYPIFATDILERNGIIGLIPKNHESEVIEEPMKVNDPLRTIQYCVVIEAYDTRDGFSEPYERDKSSEKYFFSNLPSAKLFYNKRVSQFMKYGYDINNFKEFNPSYTSWHGVKTYTTQVFGGADVQGESHFFICIKKVKLTLEAVEILFDLV